MADTAHTCCHHAATETEGHPAVATDPVCGMTVDPETSPHAAVHDGARYHFCSAHCVAKFTADPARYLEPRDEPRAPAGTLFTCPMDPEIVQEGPGSCPICGMALEPMGVPAADAGPNPELIDMTRRFWVSLVLSLPLLAIEMGPAPVRPARRRGAAADRQPVGPARPGVTGAAVGRRPVLPARLDLDRHRPPQHVHADRHRHRRGLCLQRGGDGCTRGLPGLPAHGGRHRPGLFRECCRHRHAGAVGPGPGAAGARAHLGGDTRPARPGAEDGAAAAARRHRGRRAG